MIRIRKQVASWMRVHMRLLILVLTAVSTIYVIYGRTSFRRVPGQYYYGHYQVNVGNTTSNCGSHDASVSDVDLRILVLTFKRTKHLSRLLESLNNALYDGDKVHLEIWVDVPSDNVVNAEILDVATKFEFRHGCRYVNVHRKHVGIIGQWIYTWQERNDIKEIAVIFEDDITVSPHFYRYLKIVHRKYGYLPFVNGFALQGDSMKHSGGKGNLTIPKDHKVFLYPTLGTWGFSPNRKNWDQFVTWFTEMQQVPSFIPIVPDHIASDWYLQFVRDGRYETMWEMWHIYYAWKSWEYTLYPNFPDNRGLTFNWKAEGLHYEGLTEASEDSDSVGLLLTWDKDFAKHLHDIPLVSGNDGLVKHPPIDVPQKPFN